MYSQTIVLLFISKKVNILCIPLPLYHAFACSGVLAVLSHGGKFVSPSVLYNGRETVKAIEQEKYEKMLKCNGWFYEIVLLSLLIFLIIFFQKKN